MSAKSCILKPEAPNGEISRLYEDLLKAVGNRSLANWFYASYNASNAAQVMENAGIKKNRQGQHNAKDVLEFFNWKKIQSEISDITLVERQIGAVDSNGNRVDFKDAKQALDIADNLNSNSKGLVATVIQHSNNFNVIVSKKGSNNNLTAQNVKEKLQAWDIYKHVFNSVGIDLDAIPEEIKESVNANNVNLINQLHNLQLYSVTALSKRDTMLLFTLNANSPQVQRLVGSFGSLENAAQAIDDINHNRGNYTPGQMRLLVRAVQSSQQFQGIDLNAVKQQVSNMTAQLKSSDPEEAVAQEVHKLNKKYNIGINEEHLISTDITHLSQAAAEAAFILERRIRELKREEGNNVEGKAKSQALNTLLKELNTKRYYSGLIDFYRLSIREIASIDALLKDTLPTGTDLEKAFYRAKNLRQVDKIYQQYYPLISALAKDYLTIDESISNTDIDNLRRTAKKLQNFFDKKEKVIQESRKSIMVSLLTEILGDNLPEGVSIINTVEMMAADSSIMDNIYSMGTASNPIISAMGSVIHTAQDKRNKFMNDISYRIRKATDELYKSGSNTEFMYEDDGHIISDIDWAAYDNARTLKIKELVRQGLKDFDLKEAIEQWEEDNTEEREVNSNDHRTERVPDGNYRKAFPDLTPAQQKYYDTIMQIKGEIGSLLPAYAQNQYLPAQLRRNMVDALSNAKGATDVYKAFKNKVQDVWKIREDDADYSKNGIIDGVEYSVTQSSFDNKTLKQIPIFYVNKVEQGELLKDFSAGLQALAGTAINYYVMDDIQEVVEFMGDYAKDQAPKESESEADMIGNRFIRLFKDLKKRGVNSNTHRIVDGFLGQYLYGEKIKPGKWRQRLSKFVTNLVGYTSFKGLATNVKGMISNWFVGELQMLIEAGAGEFYSWKDLGVAHARLFGKAGMAGEMMEICTNNKSHKATLIRDLFDPLDEEFSTKSHQRYHSSWFRHILSKDLSFMGYGVGEYLIHYVNMYSILNHEKVNLNGETISLYDAFELTDEENGNRQLVLKPGVTTIDGKPVEEFIDEVKRKIRYCNHTTHGAMNEEDKGIIHQYLLGKMAMNFRQWMVGHYSRRFRGAHWDYNLRQTREGYYISVYKHLLNQDTKEEWKYGSKLSALGLFMKDLLTFTFRMQSQWNTLSETQKYNVKRAHNEILMYLTLCGMSLALGDPDRHKREFWRRMCIYQIKRAILDTEGSMPMPQIISATTTMVNSPMASVSVLNSNLYLIYGLFNGDLFEDIKSGKHKGENRYWRNVKKYALPFFKDWEQMELLSEDDSIFKVFEHTPNDK